MLKIRPIFSEMLEKKEEDESDDGCWHVSSPHAGSNYWRSDLIAATGALTLESQTHANAVAGFVRRSPGFVRQSAQFVRL